MKSLPHPPLSSIFSVLIGNWSFAPQCRHVLAFGGFLALWTPMLFSSRQRGEGERKDKPFFILFLRHLLRLIKTTEQLSKKWNRSLFQATNDVIAKNIVHNLDSEIEIIENKLIYWPLLKRGRIYQSSDIRNTILISNSVESLFQCWSSVTSMFNILFSRNRCLSVLSSLLNKSSAGSGYISLRLSRGALCCWRPLFHATCHWIIQGAKTHKIYFLDFHARSFCTKKLSSTSAQR